MNKSDQDKSDQEYMRRAIELAKKGSGHVNPNPLVGAVIVKDGEIIGEGYHECYGQLHAERNAIADAKRRGNSIEGSTIYVTLEPCCHYGKTPPCTEAVIEEKIARVVVGSDDPNPKVAGRGFDILKEHGVQVETHVLKEECDAINSVFFHYIQTKLPYVAMKYAMTMDGKIACYTGDSKWITGEAARGHVHMLRNHYKGIMTGIGTVLADDPMFNCRMPGGRDPVRIVCDSHLRIPLESKLVQTALKQPLILACLEGTDEKKIQRLTEKGVEVLTFAPNKEGRLPLSELMTELGKRNVDGILLEGGGTLNESMLQEGLIHRVYCYVAPKIFGGALAKSPIEGEGKAFAREAWKFHQIGVRTFGEDILIEYEAQRGKES